MDGSGRMGRKWEEQGGDGAGRRADLAWEGGRIGGGAHQILSPFLGPICLHWSTCASDQSSAVPS